MAEISLKTIHEDLVNLQKDLQFIKHAISEDFELSKEAERQLQDARKTSKVEFIKQQDVEKEFLT